MIHVLLLRSNLTDEHVQEAHDLMVVSLFEQPLYYILKIAQWFCYSFVSSLPCSQCFSSRDFGRLTAGAACKASMIHSSSLR